MPENYFVTDASRRRWFAYQSRTQLWKDAPTNLKDRYSIYVFHGDGCGDPTYPKTFEQWMKD